MKFNDIVLPPKQVEKNGEATYISIYDIFWSLFRICKSFFTGIENIKML